jgi:glucose dehydrogenase
MPRWFGALLTLVAVLAVSLIAQNDWTNPGQDPGATKYSTLDQINTANVGTLTRAWTFHTGDKSGFFESTPLVVNSVMYFSAQNGFYALDAVSGRQLWKYDAVATTRRGVSYWPGDARTPARIFASTRNQLVALDAKTGTLVPEFGNGGSVDMGSSMASPPAIYKDLIFTPGSEPVIRAWSAHSGALVWTFHLVAQPGDPAHKTWENDVWKTIDGTNVWGYLSVDAERGILYIPNSIAGSDYTGMERPGDNLYGTSLVAVDANSGKLKWYQQFVHHDIWDYDLAAAPTLFSVVRNGRTIPAVAEINKMGLLFMLDRVSGGPIFDLIERPAPQSQVPGEKTSPTQPFPVKPPPLARNSITRAELATNVTPELVSYCLGLWDKYHLQDSGPYTPWGFNQDVVVFPGAVGGGNWQGVSYNAKLGLIITNVMNAGQWGHVEVAEPNTRGRSGAGRGRSGQGDNGVPDRGPGNDAGPTRGREGGPGSTQGFRKLTPEGGRFWDPKTKYSCAPPPWGELIAVNANTGDIQWRVPLGIFEELDARGIKTGTPGLGGGITTAGDLVFIGASIDGRFRAFDARDGRELWSERLAAPAHSIPSTYLGRDGKQYVAVAVGGGGFLNSPTSDEVIAFRLP